MSLKKIVAQYAPIAGTVAGAAIGGAVGGPAGASIGAKAGGTFGKAAGQAAGGKYAPQSASSLPMAKSQDRARLSRTHPMLDAPMPDLLGSEDA